MPTLEERITKATFGLYKELNCVRGDVTDAELTVDDVVRLDVEKMMSLALDCLAAVGEAQRVRVALKVSLKLQEGGETLTSAQQAARNKVFLAAVNVVTQGLTHDGADAPAWMDFSTYHLLRAFPGSGKYEDGRGWLPMHWAVVAGGNNGKLTVTDADAKHVYASDPLALRTHHLVTITNTESEGGKFGYTAAHLLCGMKMTKRNMSLVRHLSVSDPKAFTMNAVDGIDAVRCWSGLHVACCNYGHTETLLRLLVQLDPSQMNSVVGTGGALGQLCLCAVDRDDRLVRCLAEANSSTNVVFAAIHHCVGSPQVTMIERAVDMLLEINPAAARHKGDKNCTIAHHVCSAGTDGVSPQKHIGVLKLLQACHKDTLKEVNEFDRLPAHVAAGYSHIEFFDYVLGEYPGAAAHVDKWGQNLLHITVNITVTAAGEPDENRAAKVRLLCARFPHMVLQRDCHGHTPLLRACICGNGPAVRLMCEVGGQEAASTAVKHPTKSRHRHNGWLPLHFVIERHSDRLTGSAVSEMADAFHLLLRVYPEGAGTEGGAGVGYRKTPYRLAFDKILPAHYRRLLLRAAPHLEPAELRRLNWAERRMGLFVALLAVSGKRTPLLARLRAENKDLVKHVVSFL